MKREKVLCREMQRLAWERFWEPQNKVFEYNGGVAGDTGEEERFLAE